MNYIFVPDIKYFVLPCIMLKNWFEKQEKDAVLIVKKGLEGTFNQLDINFISLSSFNEIKVLENDHFIFLHHGIEQVYNFFESIISQSKYTEINVSFLPDGLGNAMWGTSFIDRYNNTSNKIKVNLIHAFNFGFEHGSAIKKFGQVTTVDYSYLTDFLDSNSYLIELCSKVIKEMNLSEHNVILPYRPWCTKSFHDGIYDIGDNKYLAEIYLKQLDLIGTDKVESKVYFRGDSRFNSECKEVLSTINSSVSCTEIGASYPSWLTLEPLIYFLLKQNKSYNFITLDSTTFQAIPFLNKSNQSEVTAVIGCPYSLLDINPITIEFTKKKLNNKIKDFKQRYELFDKIGFPLTINTIDSGCFTVKLM
jgi:hypothetical protein